MLNQVQEGYVKTETQQSITTIEFFHPQSNSLPGKILQELATAIHTAGDNENCKLVILKSSGEKAFCAGASFTELMSITNESEGLHFFSGFANVINAMRKCPKLIIGRIHGKCVGGGVGLAAACDYAIALEGADIKLSELALGIGPFVVGPAIERKIGLAAFSELAINAVSWHSSNWANQKGLYAEVHSSIESMELSIKKLSSFLTDNNPPATTELKKALWHNTENWDALLQERAAISGKLVLSEFTKNYIKEFKERAKR